MNENPHAIKLCQALLAADGDLAFKLLLLTTAGDDAVAKYFPEHRNKLPEHLRSLCDAAIVEAAQQWQKHLNWVCDRDRTALEKKARGIVPGVEVVYLKDGVTYKKMEDVS